MNEANFTKGPWSVGGIKEKQNYVEIDILNHDGWMSVAKLIGSTNPMYDSVTGARDVYANAAIVANAPSLYREIERSIGSLEAILQDIDDNDVRVGILLVISTHHAALKEARGE